MNVHVPGENVPVSPYQFSPYISLSGTGICLVPFNRGLPRCLCSCRDVHNIQIHGPEEVTSNISRLL